MVAILKQIKFSFGGAAILPNWAQLHARYSKREQCVNCEPILALKLKFNMATLTLLYSLDRQEHLSHLYFNRQSFTITLLLKLFNKSNSKREILNMSLGILG